ncbi:MAG: hypothetical protein AB8B70_06680 [Prochlorococcus sp.]
MWEDQLKASLLSWILLISLSTCCISPAKAWGEGDRQAYNNKMAMLKVMLEGARQRAVEQGDVETLCLIMSIGNDVTVRYVQLRPSEEDIHERLIAMRNDLTACLALMYSRVEL